MITAAEARANNPSTRAGEDRRTAAAASCRAVETGVLEIGVVPPVGVAIESSLAAISSALWIRSAGFFSRHRRTRSFIAGGMVLRYRTGGSGRSAMCAASIPCGVGATNGVRPQSISYAMAPTA